ncbi:MAG: site-specific DNA-methyltransferase [Chloroflexi bacterium]|nr:MAG: DNA methyltransferase [Phototrophicales bacterium]RMF78935.1 MAG: site-specific DNA-methyltransferase [Chloroflexota bacterium]
MTEDKQLALFQEATHTSDESAQDEAKESANTKPRANNLDGKAWTRNSISIWSDLRKTSEETKLKHPAMFPLALVSRAIECFTTQDDRVVLDPFAGVGTTLIAARDAGKQGIGIELSSDFATIARNRLQQKPLLSTAESGEAAIHIDDARHLLKYVEPDSVDFCITSPPYWDILLRDRTADYKDRRDYGDAEGDIGKIEDYQQFLNALGTIMSGVLTALRPAKYCLMIVMDIRKKSKFYPFHADVADKMQEIGFIYDDLIIWDRRHEYNNMRPLGYPYKFRINKAHEFILIFQKPA